VTPDTNGQRQVSRRAADPRIAEATDVHTSLQRVGVARQNPQDDGVGADDDVDWDGDGVGALVPDVEGDGDGVGALVPDIDGDGDGVEALAPDVEGEGDGVEALAPEVDGDDDGVEAEAVGETKSGPSRAPFTLPPVGSLASYPPRSRSPVLASATGRMVAVAIALGWRMPTSQTRSGGSSARAAGGTLSLPWLNWTDSITSCIPCRLPAWSVTPRRTLTSGMSASPSFLTLRTGAEAPLGVGALAQSNPTKQVPHGVGSTRLTKSLAAAVDDEFGGVTMEVPLAPLGVVPLTVTDDRATLWSPVVAACGTWTSIVHVSLGGRLTVHTTSRLGTSHSPKLGVTVIGGSASSFCG
jgi:hypothetical protein